MKYIAVNDLSNTLSMVPLSDRSNLFHPILQYARSISMPLRPPSPFFCFPPSSPFTWPLSPFWSLLLFLLYWPLHITLLSLLVPSSISFITDPSHDPCLLSDHFFYLSNTDSLHDTCLLLVPSSISFLLTLHMTPASLLVPSSISSYFTWPLIPFWSLLLFPSYWPLHMAPASLLVPSSIYFMLTLHMTPASLLVPSSIYFKLTLHMTPASLLVPSSISFLLALHLTPF